MYSNPVRPLDFLDSFKSKEVIILLDNQTEIIGNLLSFDIHLNLVLDTAKEFDLTKSSDENSRHLGLIFLRGSKIIHISPLNTKIAKFK